MLQVPDSDEEDHIQHDPVIETESQEILDPDPVPIPNQNPKPIWAQKFIDAVGNDAGDPEDRRRTRSHYQNEHVELSHRFSPYRVVQRSSRLVLLDDGE